MSGILRSRSTMCTGLTASASIAWRPDAASVNLVSGRMPSDARIIRRIVGESSTMRIVRIRKLRETNEGVRQGERAIDDPSAPLYLILLAGGWGSGWGLVG